MENTLENKAKFFALYWGQNIYVKEPDKITGTHVFKSNIGISSIGNYWFESSFISLMSMSKITKKDLIQLVEISMPYLKSPDFKIYKGYNNNGHTIDESVICLEVTEYIDIIDQDVLHALIQIDTEENDIITSIFEDDGKILRDDVTDNIIHIIDYLRSQGYALPWMGLSVEKLIEYGWIKLKED